MLLTLLFGTVPMAREKAVDKLRGNTTSRSASASAQTSSDSKCEMLKITKQTTFELYVRMYSVNKLLSDVYVEL